MNGPLILPSILECDFSDLKDVVYRLEDADCQVIHLDVMDGNFVPNLTYGLPIIKAFRKLTHMTLDTHLMVRNPASYIVPYYLEGGCNPINLHAESSAVSDCVEHLQNLSFSKEENIDIGIAINPSTKVSNDNDAFRSQLSRAIQILVMSVNPGRGGQLFISHTINKIKLFKAFYPKHRIVVDGGINEQNLEDVIAAGADWIVVGSAIFRQENWVKAYKELQKQANELGEKYAAKEGISL